MNLSVGIVGLPNVGKSTLFNALLKKQQALAANYPFATIEPNIGIVPVPDERLQKLAEITAEEIQPHPDPLLKGEGNLRLPPIKPATVEFVDIAGLVKGASEGAGLGNKFLSHIREVSVIAHVVRAFEDPNVIREGSTDTKSDYETIKTELILADIQTLGKSKVKSENSKVQVKSQKFIDEILIQLNKGVSVRDMVLGGDERTFIDSLFLLSAKPEIIVLNVSEDQYNPEGIKETIETYKTLLSFRAERSAVEESNSRNNTVEIDPSTHPAQRGSVGMTRQDDNIVVICAKIESELSELSEDEQKQYLEDLGLKESGLEQLIRKAYAQLGLISFLTAGEKEVRAWTIKKGTDAQHAAGEIHTDFIKHFIKAEVVSYGDFVAYKGWKGSREAGKARQEGKDYIMHDGDVVEFRIGK